MRGEFEDQALEIEFREALGVIADSVHEPRRLRLLNAAGEEIANLTGLPAPPDWVEEEGEPFAEILFSDGGLSARAKIALDPKTRCTVSPDGTLTGTLPSEATWIASSL
jgi:hypothetical protein